MFVRSIFNVLDFLHSDVGGIESWLFIDNKTQQVKHILRMDSQMERLLGHDFCIRDQECSTIDIEIDDPKLFPGKRFTTSSSFRKIVNFVLKFWMEGRNNFASEIHLSASELGKDDIKTFGYYHFKDYVDNLNVLELSAYLKPITETYNPSKSIGSSFDPHSLEL